MEMSPHRMGILSKLFETIGKPIYIDANLTRQLAFSILSSEFRSVHIPGSTSVEGGVEYWIGFVSGVERKIFLKDIGEVAQIVEKSPVIEVALNMIFQILMRQKEMFIEICKNMSDKISNLRPEALRSEIKDSIKSTIDTGFFYPHYISKYKSQEFFEQLYNIFSYERVFVYAGLIDVIGPPVRGAVKVKIGKNEYVLGKLRTASSFIELTLGQIPLENLTEKFYMYTLIPWDGYESLRIFGDDFKVVIVGIIKRHLAYNPVEESTEQQSNKKQPRVDKYLKVVAIFDSRGVSKEAVKEFMDMTEILGYSVEVDFESLFSGT